MLCLGVRTAPPAPRVVAWCPHRSTHHSWCPHRPPTIIRAHTAPMNLDGDDDYDDDDGNDGNDYDGDDIDVSILFSAQQLIWQL